MVSEQEYIIDSIMGKEIVRKRSDPQGGTADYVYVANSGRIYRPVDYDGTATIPIHLKKIRR